MPRSISWAATPTATPRFIRVTVRPGHRRDPETRAQLPGAVVDVPFDPFDNYVLTMHDGGAPATDTNRFSQMEANFSLFSGLAVHAWVTMLVPDDSPMDRFFDANPDSFSTFGESGEPGIAKDLRNCYGEGGTGGVAPCFTEVGNFKRDPGVFARIGFNVEGGTCDPAAGCEIFPAGGTRVAGQWIH